MYKALRSSCPLCTHTAVIGLPCVNKGQLFPLWSYCCAWTHSAGHECRIPLCMWTEDLWILLCLCVWPFLKNVVKLRSNANFIAFSRQCLVPFNLTCSQKGPGQTKHTHTHTGYLCILQCVCKESRTTEECTLSFLDIYLK